MTRIRFTNRLISAAFDAAALFHFSPFQPLFSFQGVDNTQETNSLSNGEAVFAYFYTYLYTYFKKKPAIKQLQASLHYNFKIHVVTGED